MFSLAFSWRGREDLNLRDAFYTSYSLSRGTKAVGISAFFSHCTLLRYLLLCLDSLQIRFSDRIDALMHRLRIWVNV